MHIIMIFYFPGFQLFIAVSSLWRLPYVSILQNWEPWQTARSLPGLPPNWSRKGQAAGHSDWRWG